MTKLTVLLFVSVLVFTNARHIHLHGDPHAKPQEVEEIWLNGAAETEKNTMMKEKYVNVEVLEEVPRNIKPNRFVPLNNAIFFMGHMPCAEEGFKRDYMGICREVWD